MSIRFVGRNQVQFSAENLSGAEGAVSPLLPMPEIVVPFEGVFERAA